MRETEYIELLADNKFKEHIIPIFDQLEKYVEPKTEYSADSLNYISVLLNNDELRSHISAIIKTAKTDKSKILSTYALSFQRNVTGYIKMENSEQNVRRKKLAKLLLSYINVTRYIVDYNTIEELINRGPQNGEKLVLALGLVNIDEDDIKVNTEIDRIVELSRLTDNFFVIPIYGCSTNVFAKITQQIHSSIIHMAGHGIHTNKGRTAICFVDSHMSFSRLCEKIATRKELIFLNCCNTYEYIEMSPIPVSDHALVHEGDVRSNVAYSFCESFYSTLWQTDNLNAAWDAAKTTEEPLKYHLL